ncbi:DLW-39 family protein [Nakamurella sp.]
MKKILVLLAVLGGIAFLVQRRRQAAAAEAALWDEATKPVAGTGFASSAS